MPELPEVETVRRGLEPVMVGRTIRRVDVRRPDLRWPLPAGLADSLAGREVFALRRRAKYLLIDLSDHHTMVSHLGMSGSWRIESATERPSDPVGASAHYYARGKLDAHDHLVLHLGGADGFVGSVVYNDPRRFGFVLLEETSRVEQLPGLSVLGVEPTAADLSAGYLAEMLGPRRTPLKSALLDQRVIAGLGNIYVCEALWRARLSPRRNASTLKPLANGKPSERVRRLVAAIAAVIEEAIEAGGSSLRDHIRSDGTMGYFQHRFDVYDREGKPCRRPRCGGVVRRLVQSGRSTFYCPVCQR